MLYTVGEMAKLLGIAPSTIRYYDQEGMLPFVERSSSGVRVFKETDYEWLRIIEYLKKTGMKLKDIKRFILMAMEGDTTIPDRLEMIIKQQSAVAKQIEELQNTLEILNYKRWYYETARKAGTTKIFKGMKNSDLPEQYREAQKRFVSADNKK